MDDSHFSEIVRVGFLTKKGAFQVGGWKRRYFVLKVDPTSHRAKLGYYRKQSDVAPAGEILLDQVSAQGYHCV
jgi:hypothetical protein